MAKVTDNIMMRGLSGSLGKDFYVRRMRDGRTIISKKPDFDNRQFSEAQLAHQHRMKQAAAYATVAKETNPIYAKLAEGKASNAYNLALGDWLNPPVIRRIQYHQGQVRVRAIDDVMVTRVTVSVLNEAGECLEQGEAELWMGVWWDYNTTNRGRIHVEAWDLAGNVVRQEFDPPSEFFSVWETASPVKKRRR